MILVHDIHKDGRKEQTVMSKFTHVPATYNMLYQLADN